MYSFPILLEKKARALLKNEWRDIPNPLYQGNTFLDEETYPAEEYILEVYPHRLWYIGPGVSRYQGTRILVYSQYENVKIPRYLIWIDRVTSGDVVFAYETSDMIIVVSPLATVVQADILTEVYELSANPHGNKSSK